MVIRFRMATETLWRRSFVARRVRRFALVLLVETPPDGVCLRHILVGRHPINVWCLVCVCGEFPSWLIPPPQIRRADGGYIPLSLEAFSRFEPPSAATPPAPHAARWLPASGRSVAGFSRFALHNSAGKPGFAVVEGVLVFSQHMVRLVVLTNLHRRGGFDSRRRNA